MISRQSSLICHKHLIKASLVKQLFLRDRPNQARTPNEDAQPRLERAVRDATIHR